ncbi:hypothetical protein ScPMuIL_002962 [Solemya velum]
MGEPYKRELVEELRDVVRGSNWQCVGEVALLKQKKCQRVFVEEGEDLVLLHTAGKFYAMEALCAHEGGPLDDGDIEDLDGRAVVVCPWHSFEFDLETGESSSGLKQDVYRVETVGGEVYINIASDVSLYSNRQDRIPEEITTVPSSSSGKVCDPADKDSLTYWAVQILNTADPDNKVSLTEQIGELWRSGEITAVGYHKPPDQPCRDPQLSVVDPGKEKRRGRGGTLSSRITNLHALANIEQWAIDLAWDIIARFSGDSVAGQPLPKTFFDDFVKVACDEAKHYSLISTRLRDLGSHFGSQPVHNGLWQTASETSESLLARLAVVHMVHEARGLDVQPHTLEKFARHGDEASAKVLEVVYEEEITHVAAGLKWFTYICTNSNPTKECIPTFHELVRKHFRGYLKPPFNFEGRESAGMVREWYLPLVKPIT